VKWHSQAQNVLLLFSLHLIFSHAVSQMWRDLISIQWQDVEAGVPGCREATEDLHTAGRTWVFLSGS